MSAGACFVGGLILLLLLNNVLRFAFISSLTVTCIALSVVVLTGYVGQVSLAQMSLAGIGGFMLGHISHGWGLGFPFSLIVAGLCAVPVGLVIGLPALRLRGVNLAVVTLGFAAAMDALIFSSAGFAGGTPGLPIKSPHLLGLNLAANVGRSTNRVIFGVMVLVVVILIGLLVARLRRGPAGRMLLAIRSNERAAGSVGINVAQGKLMAFALAAFIAGDRRRPDGLLAGRADRRQLRGVHVDQPAGDRVRGRRRADRGSGRRRGHVLGRGPARHLPRHPPERRQVPGDRRRRRPGVDRGPEPGRPDQHLDRQGPGGGAVEAPRSRPRAYGADVPRGAAGRRRRVETGAATPTCRKASDKLDVHHPVA